MKKLNTMKNNITLITTREEISYKVKLPKRDMKRAKQAVKTIDSQTTDSQNNRQSVVQTSSCSQLFYEIFYQ